MANDIGLALKEKQPSVSGEALQRLIQAGITSDFLKARIQYAGAATLLSHHLRPMAGICRVFPSMVIPQASGRVGISDPPLGNFTADLSYGPHGLRDVVRPDPGHKWICPDWNAVEGWIVSHRCQDRADLEAKRRGLDLHTTTAIYVLGYPDPPVEPTKENLRSDAGVQWAQSVGFTPTLRDVIKHCRYALQNSKDEKALARYALPLGIPKETLWEIGRKYLRSKPGYVAFKQKRMDDIWRLKEARTAFGRRRRFPVMSARDRYRVQKEGFSHEISGTVADLMKMTMVSIANAFPGCAMMMQRHDGWVTQVPATWGSPEDWAKYKAIVEREWMIDGRPVNFAADYEVWELAEGDAEANQGVLPERAPAYTGEPISDSQHELQEVSQRLDARLLSEDARSDS